MRCKHCKYWTRTVYTHGSGEQIYGTCSSDHIVVNENYYTFSETPLRLDGIETTYDNKVGEKYGCIHFEEMRDENNSQRKE